MCLLFTIPGSSCSAFAADREKGFVGSKEADDVQYSNPGSILHQLLMRMVIKAVVNIFPLSETRVILHT